MNDDEKTKEQLIQELVQQRQRYFMNIVYIRKMCALVEGK